MKSGQILFCIFISKPYWHILGARYHNNVESVEHKPFRCSKKQDGVCTFLRCCFVIVVVIVDAVIKNFRLSRNCGRTAIHVPHSFQTSFVKLTPPLKAKFKISKFQNKYHVKVLTRWRYRSHCICHWILMQNILFFLIKDSR